MRPVVLECKGYCVCFLFAGRIAKNTPSRVVLYFLIPNNLYMSWKFKIVNSLTALGSTLMAIAVLMLVWKLMKFEEAKKA